MTIYRTTNGNIEPLSEFAITRFRRAPKTINTLKGSRSGLKGLFEARHNIERGMALAKKGKGKTHYASKSLKQVEDYLRSDIKGGARHRYLDVKNFKMHPRYKTDKAKKFFLGKIKSRGASAMYKRKKLY